MRTIKVIKPGEVDSTNNYARGQVVSVEAVEGTVVMAWSQVRGRGNGSNLWESEPGKNLTFSIHLKPTFLEPARQFCLSMAVSLGVYDFVRKYSGEVSIKWPNDIYVGNRKIAGILIENMVTGNRISDTIAGIGININQEKFVSDAPNPVSLKQLSGIGFDLEKCLEEVLDAVFFRYDWLRIQGNEVVQKDYLPKLFRINRWAKYKAEGRIFSGKIIGIGDFGELIIETNERQTRQFGFKEVEFLI